MVGSINLEIKKGYPLSLSHCYSEDMINDSSDNSNVKYDGKVKTQTFKQFQLERLIKDGTVIPASKLAEAKDLELQRSRDFEASIEDEERHRRTASIAPEEKLKNLPLTRERFED